MGQLLNSVPLNTNVDDKKDKKCYAMVMTFGAGNTG